MISCWDEWMIQELSAEGLRGVMGWISFVGEGAYTWIE